MIRLLFRQTCYCFAALSLAASCSLSQAEQAVTGEWVARQMDARDTGEDGRLEMEMRLYDHRDRETLRRFVVFTRRQGTFDRLLLQFTHPGDMRDTGLLSIDDSDRQESLHLYLPAVGRTHRISAREKQGPFVGSDLTYEDVSGPKLEDYDYRLLGQEELDGAPVYVLDATRRDERARYPRIVSWVDRVSFVVRKSEIYDRTGEKAKEYHALGIDRVEGIWTATRITMRDLRHGTRTVLVLTKAEYNRGLSPRLFEPTNLGRGVSP